jgi:hypothetical protein
VGMIINNKDDDYCWWNRIPYEIECKGQIECYDKVNELHPKYPIIIYNYTLKYKQKVKEYLDKIKS